ncbi:MAG: class I SAM-dependent methyltransferase [Chloroflexi bacterium]|nr:class I SAM-dependent methyltransferase [Chloroflexota bacterium]
MDPNSKVYDELAESWYHLRHYTRFRRELQALAERWQGGRLLNIGCGHGPDFLPFKDRTFGLYGLDISGEMLRFARKYADKFRFTPALVLGDAVSLPFRDSSFDFVIAVAAYHHIRGGENRRQAFRELWRVLRPGGEAFITVWNLRQGLFSREVLVPWKTGGKTLYRYVYVYSPGELRKELRGAGFHILSQRPRLSLLRPFYRNITLLVARAA